MFARADTPRSRKTDDCPSYLKDFGYYDTKTQSYNIATSVQLAINLLMLVGSVLACLVAGIIGTRYGRRVGLLCCGFAGLIGPILQASSTHIATMYIGRLLSGGKTTAC